MTALHSCGVWLQTKLAEAAAAARESPCFPPPPRTMPSVPRWFPFPFPH